MNKISELENRIRDLIHPGCWWQITLVDDYYKWNSLCSSLDTIGDTEHAIESYFKLSTFSSHEGYIYLYGLLQSFILQQDAVKTIHDAILDSEFEPKSDKDISEIRDIRNKAIGHPTNQGRKPNRTFNFITRMSIKNSGFTLSTYNENENKSVFTEINLFELHLKHKNSIVNILTQITNFMEQEYINHKSKFSENKLEDLIPANFDYCVSVIYRVIDGSHSAYRPCFNTIKDTIETIKTELNKRYISYNNIASIKSILDDLDFILDAINNWYIADETIDKRGTKIFLDSFINKFEELKNILKDIDEIFKSDLPDSKSKLDIINAVETFE